MKRIANLTAAVLLLFEIRSRVADASGPKVKDDVEQRIERVINRLRPVAVLKNQQRYGPETTLKDRMSYYRTPGVSIAVVNDYRIDWARGFGVLEQSGTEPVTETTLFQAASISKPIFAMAVMRLVQEGKLDLNEDVNRYLKSWKVPSNGSWQPRVTLRQILSNSAGLTVSGFPGYRTTEKLPTLVEVLNGQSPANTPPVQVDILPGVQSRYSGGGTTLAGLLVADVLGKPLPQIMHDLILEPLGMKHSTFEQPLPTKWHQYAATAHASMGDPVPGKWHVYPELAPDGLWTTPSDLARAGIEMQLACKGESNRLLAASTATEMLTPVVESVGIAFMIDGKDKSVRFGHGGSNAGFESQMTMYKELGKGAVIMINSNDGFPILREIERAIAQEYDWPDHTLPEKKAFALSGEAMDAFVGNYASESGFTCTIAKRDNRLYLTSTGQPALELIPESETKFFATVITVEVTFQRTEKGEVKGLTLDQDHRQTVAQKKR